MRRSLPGIAFVDFLSNLLLVFVVLFVLSYLLIRPRASPPAISTFGAYAVVIRWPDRSNDDVDLYVEDPQGSIAYFANPNAGLMHLEHDDLGTAVSGTERLPGGRTVVVSQNGERTVIRGIVPGEYVANVHMYRKAQPGTTPVTVRLYRLIGADAEVTSRTVLLRADGDERTAFRFRLDAGGRVTEINHLERKLVGSAHGG